MANRSATSELRAGRVMSHGKIADLTTGFKLDGGGTPFALFIIEKATGDTIPVIVDCETWLGDSAEDCPFTPNVWDVPLLYSISNDGIDTDLYDVYWGAGWDTTEDDS